MSKVISIVKNGKRQDVSAEFLKAWTEQARQAALEARRARMKGKPTKEKPAGGVGRIKDKHITQAASDLYHAWGGTASSYRASV